MANVGTGNAGKTLIGAGIGSSPTFADIGTNSGLTAHSIVLSQGNGAFTALGAATNGQIPIGSSGANPVLATIIAGNGINITNGPGSIVLSVNGSTVGQTITGTSGGALSPTGGNWNILAATVAAGTTPIATAGAASTLTINVQTSQALAAADATKIGLCNFDSASFAVSATGFVTLANPSGMPWTDVTGATQTLAVNNGYFTDRGGGVTYTLPATAALGDQIKIDGKLGITTVAQNANQAIRMSGSISTTGVGGSIAGTNVGDCVTLRCSTAGASTIWIAENFVGNWTVN